MREQNDICRLWIKSTNSPAYCCAHTGHLEHVRILLEGGANVNKLDIKCKSTYLVRLMSYSGSQVNLKSNLKLK